MDLGAVYTSRVTARIDALAESVSATMSTWGSLAEVESLEPADPDDWEVTLEYRVTDDDPAGSPVWSAWTPLTVGDLKGRAFEFRALLSGVPVEGSDPPYATTTPLVRGLSVEIDMPDRIDSVKDLVVPVTGIRVAFTPPFRTLKGVTFGHQDLAPGDRAEVTNKDESGFDVRFFNSSAVAVERTTDVNAVGYGVQS